MRPTDPYPGLDDCVHCGLCLPVCPTYAVDKRESENPRGRIAALRAVEEGRAPLSDKLLAGLEDCLVCRACESACPSGISMERLMLTQRERTRPVRADLASRLERWLLSEVIAHPERLERALGFLRFARPAITALRSADLPHRDRFRPLPLPSELSPRGAERGRVTILRGCIADRLFRRETLDAARLLAHVGYRVTFRSAGCCGALHRHAGLVTEATSLASARARDLLADRPDHLVMDSAGCGAAMAEPLDGDPAVAEVAERLTDTPTLLLDAELPTPVDPPRGPIAFFPPCHQEHGTRTTMATRALLTRVFPAGVISLPGEERCCGAAGLYLLRRRGRSSEIGALARERWVRAGQPNLATGNPGCLLRWESLVRGVGGIVQHPVRWAREILLP